MAKKFHIGESGPAECRAHKRPCPVGGEHFDSMEKAEKTFNTLMERTHSDVMVKKSTTRLTTTRFGAAALTMVAAMSFSACDTVSTVSVPDNIPSVSRTDVEQKVEKVEQQVENNKSKWEKAKEKIEQSRDAAEKTRDKIEQEFDKTSTTTSQKADGSVTSEMVSNAKNQLSRLETRTKYETGGYDRNEYFGGWKDTDGNDCDTRNDILQRDLSDVKLKSGSKCTVVSGVLKKDPYTGKTIFFQRGKRSSDVQIDHVVSLHDAWNSGMGARANQSGSAKERKSIANDPDNLVAVDGPTNMNVKGDKTAAEWTPHTDYQCTYVIKQVNIKSKYKLSVTKIERQSMESILNNSCNVG